MAVGTISKYPEGLGNEAGWRSVCCEITYHFLGKYLEKMKTPCWFPLFFLCFLLMLLNTVGKALLFVIELIL